jgi:hypothetical protein
MPVKVVMSWLAKTSRWEKRVMGRRFVVSCRQLKRLGYMDLHLPETKEHSRDAANRWLADQLGKKTPSRYDRVLQELEARKAWSQQEGHDASGIDQMIAFVSGLSDDDPDAADADAFIDPYLDVRAGDPMNLVWRDRLARSKPTPTNRTVGFWIAKFLELRDVDVKAGELSRDGHDQCRWAMDAFKEWLTPSLPIDKLDSDRWVSWYKHVQSLGNKAWTKKKLFSYPKSFVSWLIEQELVPAFQSLHAKRYKFSIERVEKEPLTVERIKEIFGKAQGVMRLHLLLMLNAGLTQKDISDLVPAEYVNGRIERVRSKTRKKGTRKVSWKLWDCTRQLLDEHKAASGDRLLLTSKGTTWVGEGRRDGINSLYRHLGFPEPLKQFRATAGNMIRKKLGKEVADHFLGHKQGVVDSAYFAREQKELDNAVEWLGKQLT